MVALGLKIAVLDLSLILFIKSELLCRRFASLTNSEIPFKWAKIHTSTYTTTVMYSLTKLLETTDQVV